MFSRKNKVQTFILRVHWLSEDGLMSSSSSSSASSLVFCVDGMKFSIGNSKDKPLRDGKFAGGWRWRSLEVLLVVLLSR